jgi:magnesium-transporting ATPase (P-type)
VLSWTLPTNAGETMPLIVALLFGLTLPVTAIQILWINLISAIAIGIALFVIIEIEKQIRLRLTESDRQP